MNEIDSLNLLSNIVKKRKWYYLNGIPIFSTSFANVYKKRILEKKITETTAEKILIKLGYTKKIFWIKEIF